MLVNGKWQQDWQPVQSSDEEGRFIRQVSSFRHWVTPDGSAGPSGEGGFKAESGRYRLYVAYICPWASRTLMVRALKGLENHIPVTVVNPKLTNQGWQFGGFAKADEDPVHGKQYLHELYSYADSHFTGRATVPVLWDTHRDTIVNNESADIIRMLNSSFNGITGNTLDLYPKDLANRIDSMNDRIYKGLNNGVYQAGFATTQVAYEEAFSQVFATLDDIELLLQDGRDYLFGNSLTETDIRLFVTLVRFDSAYHGIFKCNRNILAAMPALHRYMHRVLDVKGIKETVNLTHIKAGYYSIDSLNPSGIVPLGPATL